MATISEYGSVSKTGILELTQATRKRMQHDLKAFSGHAVELTIKKKNRRSTQQNRYLFGCLYKEVEIRMNQLGNQVDCDIVHLFFKDRFLKIELLGEGGEIIGYKSGSTAELNKTDFGIYIDKIIEFSASVLSIEIPLPSTDLQFKF
jgi:hypothetical protein